jgi:hypothetical protein
MVVVTELAGRVLAGCAGVLLIYSSLFLYEPEEGKLQNVLEQWWVKIRDLHAHAMSRETAFLNVVVNVTADGFIRVFGKRLFGPKAVAASLCYSEAAILFAFSLVDHFFSGGFLGPQSDAFTTSGYAILSLFFFVLGSLSPFIQSQPRKVIWLSCVLIATVVWLPLYEVLYMRTFNRHVWGPDSTIYMPLACMLPFAIFCDFMFIVVTRVMLRRAAQSDRFLTILSFAMLNVCLAALLVTGPFLLDLKFDEAFPETVDRGLVLLAFSNVLDALVSFAWLFAALIMLVHRLLWPLIERPVYALYRYGFFTKQKKLAFFTGIALLGIATPPVGQQIEKILKLIDA